MDYPVCGEETINGEFAKQLIETVESFAALDGACDKAREREIGDAVGFKCDLSCKVYVKKKLLKFIKKCIKTIPSAPPTVAVETRPESEAPCAEPVPELPKEKLCPSCGRRTAREDSKYCDFCGEKL